jgi:Tol biopolymer transport system component
VLLGGVAAAATLVVIAAVAVLAGRDDGGQDDGGGPDGGTWTPAVLPVAAVPLAPTQLLVAAGPSNANLNVYRVDLADNTATPVTGGEGRKAGPVIGEDRDTLIFAERVAGTSDRRLRAVDPATGESDGLLLEDVPAECAQSMERPARSPTDPDVIVSPCKDASGVYSLVELDLATGEDRVLRQGVRIGDPTISRTGDTLVYWASSDSSATGGNLYMLDLTDPEAQSQQFTFGDWEDSDPIFSPVDDTVAFRRRISDTDYDLYTRSIHGFAPAKELVGGATFDQEPTYSPDGRRLAFQRGTGATGTRTWVVDLTAPDTAGPAAPLLPVPIDGFSFEMVPSWSRR